ncbi:MAG: DUF4260 family protein [Gemmatimonadota bacterium]
MKRRGRHPNHLLHTYVAPAILGSLAWWAGGPVALQVAVIWVSHIGFDRFLGFSLKHPSGFTRTHLGVLEGRP